MNNTYQYIKQFLSYFILTFILLTNQGCSQRQDKIGHPNVILILADDMGLGDLSCFNGGLTRTPNIDKLVKEGIWFNQAYSAAPVCAPARAALLTGLYPHRTNCITLGMKRFPELTKINKGLPTIADVFRDNGYTTGLIGKWHCGNEKGYLPMDRGFQEFEGFLGYMVKSYFSYELLIQDKIYKYDNQYLTDNLSERAVKFVRRHKDKPFFLHLAHYAPHRPLGAPQELVDYYLEKGFNENIATIYAMIEIMDQGIGKLMNELDSLGIREKTLVILSSDNGPDPITGPRFNQGLRGAKYSIYEGGIHVPFIVNWKGKLKPSQKKEVIHFTDVFPTLVDICNLNIPPSVDFDGGSMASLFMEKAKNILPEKRFWQWNRGVPFYSHNAAMRQGKWKLVRPFVTINIPDGLSNQRPVLYNLENDPFEEHDVSKQNHLLYESMEVMLEQWCREMEFSRLNNEQNKN